MTVFHRQSETGPIVVALWSLIAVVVLAAIVIAAQNSRIEVAANETSARMRLLLDKIDDQERERKYGVKSY